MFACIVMIIFKMRLIFSKLMRHKNVTLFVIFMFWSVEVMISIPGVVIGKYHTSDPISSFMQFGCKVDDEEDQIKLCSGLKLIRRFVFYIFNVTLFIYFVNTLENEDQQYYKSLHMKGHKQKPVVLKTPKLMHKIFQKTTYFGTPSMEQQLSIKLKN